MKKNITSICLISVLLVAIIIPISIAATAGNREVIVSADGIADRSELNKTYVIESLADKRIEVTYDMSRKVSDGFSDIYKDSNGNDYIYKNGKLTGFYSNEIKAPNTKCTPIGETLAKEISVKVLSKFTDNTNDYVIRDFDEKKNYGQYYVTIARKIGDIYSEEYAIVSIMYDGSIKSVAVYNDGEFDNVSDDIVKGVTEDMLIAYAVSEMGIIYPDKGNSFEMRDYCLEHDENGYYISIHGNIGTMAESVRYDLEG